MNEILGAARTTGLFLFLGGALFRTILWSAVVDRVDDTLRSSFRRRSNGLIVAGIVVFVTAALAGIPRADDAPGWIVIAPAALAPVFLVLFLAVDRRGHAFLRVASALTGLFIVGLLTASSHAADESGWLAPAADFLHRLAVLGWGGCLLQLAFLPWAAAADHSRSAAPLGELAVRYAHVALVAFILFVMTGGLLAFVHVHNADAMHVTLYGTAVRIKAAIVFVLLFVVSLNLLKIAPACRVSGSRAETLSTDRPLQRFRRLVSVEAMLLVALIAASSVLATRTPPGIPPFLNPQSWQMRVADLPLTLTLTPVTGSTSRVRIEVSPDDPGFRFPEGSRAGFDLSLDAQAAQLRDVEAISLGPSGFLGEASLAVPGRWRIDLHLSVPGSAPGSGSHTLVVPAQPLEQDLTPYLAFAAAGFSTANALTCLIGALLVLTAAWLIVLARRGQTPFWIMPASLANVVLGGYLLLSVLFVKTYPTTFQTNPAPFTAEVVREGDAVYREHCAECHGITGRGDGPWAIEQRGGPIPDLTSPHMDTHTDGEIYWWISYGIPSLDMPALAKDIPELDRWAVINTMRSFRHGIPADAAPIVTGP